jgi:hypothetical protein
MSALLLKEKSLFAVPIEGFKSKKIENIIKVDNLNIPPYQYEFFYSSWS